jgi:anti-sigma28 factor (negative regulator of flagellin synthesis)
MKISMQEVEKILQTGDTAVVESPGVMELPIPTVAGNVATRSEEVQAIKDAIAKEPEIREEMVAEVRALIDSGKYKPTGEEIADLMIRRARADSIR